MTERPWWKRPIVVGGGVPALAYAGILAWTLIESRTNSYAVLGTLVLFVLSIPAVSVWALAGSYVLRQRGAREDARAFASAAFLVLGVAFVLFLFVCATAVL